MNGNHEEKDELNEDDLQDYLKDIEHLETDFSDLDDLEFEEIQEMQEAIAKVREEDIKSEDTEIPESENEISDYIQQKDDLISDFSDIEQIDFDELKEMKQAIESVKKEELHSLSEGEVEPKPTQEISGELEERIKLELLEKKKKKKRK